MNDSDTTSRHGLVKRATGVHDLDTVTHGGLPAGGATLSHASTLADTWVVLRYQVNGGECNRSLSVVKSRGTAYANQVREMVLSSQGIELTDVYRYGSEVLMGTARVQKESEETELRKRQLKERRDRQCRLEREIDKTCDLVQQGNDEFERLQEALLAEHHNQTAIDHEAERLENSILRRRDAGQGGRDQ